MEVFKRFIKGLIALLMGCLMAWICGYLCLKTSLRSYNEAYAIVPFVVYTTIVYFLKKLLYRDVLQFWISLFLLLLPIITWVMILFFMHPKEAFFTFSIPIACLFVGIYISFLLVNFKQKIRHIMAASILTFMMIYMCLPYLKFTEAKNESLNENVYLVNLQDLNGNNIPPNYFKGKIVLLDFWFIECAPCRLKFKYFDKIAEKFQNNKDVIIASVALGDANTLEEVNKFHKEHLETKFQYFYDKNSQLAAKLKIDGAPMDYLIDKQGHLVSSFSGFDRSMGNLYVNNTISEIKKMIKK